jgi:ABC-2 type transport system ATP-binding protein
VTENAIETSGLAVRFGRRAVLRGVDLEVPRGSVTALVGRNGEGKSTLLKALCGVVPPCAGSARVLGLDPARKGARLRARIGIVQDRLELPAWMRVRDALRFTAAFHPTWSGEEERRLVELLRLDPRERVRDLSRGKRAALALTLALAHEPELCLLDEPFSGLDVATRRDVLSAVIGHLREAGRTILVASHALDDLARAADRLAILRDGVIALSGELEELRRGHAEARGLALSMDSLVLRYLRTDTDDDREEEAPCAA